jgi:hypothetical protein
MGAQMVPTPLILRLRSRPSEIPDRQDVFVVAAGRVVDPGGHPERVDDPGMGTPSREPGDSWSVGHREESLRRGAGAGGDLSGDCRTPTSTRSSRAHRPTLTIASRSLLLPETPVVVHAGGHSGCTTAELMTCRALAVPSDVSERPFGPPTLRGPSPAP